MGSYRDTLCIPFVVMSHARSHNSRHTLTPHSRTIFNDMQHRLAVRKAADDLKRVSLTALAGVALAMGISVVLQLAYPSSRALPHTRIGGKNYGYQSAANIHADIQRINAQKLRINIASRTLQATPAEIGIAFNATADTEQALSYTWKERLVPFSLFLERREITQYSFRVDEAKAGKFAASLVRHNKAPVDAAVRLEGTKVILTPQQEGYAYDAKRAVEDIKNMTFTSGMQVSLAPQTVLPAITDSAAMDAARMLHERLQKPITVSAGGKQVTADPATIGSWTVLKADTEKKDLSVVYDKEKVKQWLSGLAAQVYKPGAPQTVTMLDGEITTQAEAANGTQLDMDATVDAVLAAAAGNRQDVEGKMAPVIIAAQTIRNYTRSSKGLQALLNHWDHTHAGTWGIMVKDFKGGIQAEINADRHFTSASVYKIYVAYAVYEKVGAGEFGMDAGTNNGNTVSGCIDIMIVRSDNSCAHALGDMIGWGLSDGMLHARGFTDTSLVIDNLHTTARDSTKYLMDLENGGLLPANYRNELLGMMGRNIYRYAIPAGSPGMHSANKLGALGVFNHDVAIVYHPKGSYVLSVFTQGSSHGQIRELAREIAALMSQ